METEYLSKDHLVGFDHYKYSCKDTGILSIYVMHPFWNWIVQYCPRWVAPNLLTFSGFLFTLASFLLFTLLDYGFYASDPDHPEVAPLPKWTFMVAGIFLFLAYTLDGIDGKQARRTGTSSPLGELFDHGLDSYTAGLIPAAMYSIFGRGVKYSIVPFRMFFTMWNVLINFYLSHFEKYNTGVLFLPWGYDFSMWGTILTFLLAGIGGYEQWQFRLQSGITTGMMFEILLYVSSLVSNVPVVLFNIYKSYKYKTGHMRSFTEAIRPLIPVAIFFVTTLVWVLKSPSNIVEKDPRALFFLMGTIFSNISNEHGQNNLKVLNYVGGNVNERCVIEGEVVLNAGHIILHGRTDCSSSHIQLVVLCLQTSALQSEPHQISGELTILDGSAKIKSMACLCKAGAGVVAISVGTQWALLELFLTYCLCLGTTLAHIHYGTCVVRQMCRHFKVNCFTTKKQAD